jgi:MoaA/NifB/PqqE/SkfB family radical SAM enzyme
MPKRFQKVHVEISNVCNLQCSFCPEVLRPKKLISLTLFEKVISQVAPLTEQVAFHLMGDPLLHPHLRELVEICHRHGVKIFFVTNGLLMKGDKPELLLHPAFRQVNFSLHSFFDNFPDRDPGVYLDRIFSFTERAFETRPDLYINYRLWNLQDVRGRTSRNAQMLKSVAERFQVEVPGDYDVKTKKSYRLKERLYLHFDTEFIWPSLQLPFLGTEGTCYGLSSHFGVLADGRVVPCCLDKEGEITLGQLESQSLSEILSGPRVQDILAGFKGRRLVEPLCQRCKYIERFQNLKPSVNA